MWSGLCYIVDTGLEWSNATRTSVAATCLKAAILCFVSAKAEIKCKQVLVPLLEKDLVEGQGLFQLNPPLRAGEIEFVEGVCISS